ncbi:MAG: DinB family protein [Vicinamibacterales bacterium]
MHRDELLTHPVAHMAPQQVIADLSGEDAARHLLGITHSIVEIVAHMTFWQAWFLTRCAGTAVPAPAHAAEGWPTVTAADWVRVRDQYLQDLARAVAFPATGRIDPPLEHPPMANYTVDDVMIHIAQHNAHHLGQIVTLRQALGLWPPPGGSYTW